MKKIFSFLFFLLTIISSVTAANSSLKGTVVDGNSKPIDFVNVALFKKGTENPLKGVMTDKNGSFTFNAIGEGEYEIRISFVGYNTIKQPVSLKGAAVNLGKITLKENAHSLKEVEVVGQGTQVKFDVDKKIYSVDQAIATAGGVASDVLKNIPSVKVDNEGNVSLRNDANVEVWINGKPSGLTADNRAQVLQQMPAESIQSVEVMTNPSAKFNPEGTAGIINIVLKKNRKAGYYGSLSAGVMYPDGGAVRPTFGGNLNYSSSKIDAYANIGYRKMKFKGKSNTDRYNLNGTDTTSLFSQNGVQMNEFGGIFTRAGIDFHMDTINTISLSGFGMFGTGNSDNNIAYLLTDRKLNPGNILQNFNRNNIGSGFMRSFNLSLDYRHDFSKNENLMASLSFSQHRRGGDNEIVEDSLTNTTLDFTQHTLSTNREITFKTDYSKKFTSTSRIDAGWQSTLNHRFSSSSADSLGGKELELYKNDFDYNEQIHAGYLTYGDRFFDKLSVQAGLRAEYFVRESTNETAKGTIDIAPQHNFQLFPSLFLAYSLPQRNELQFNLTRRINRPRGRQINPFQDYSSAGMVSYGNANLQPEYALAYELNYIKSWDAHSISTSLYYRTTTNGIEGVQFKNGDLLESTYMNLSKRQNSGVEIVAKDRVLKVVNLTSTLNLFYKHINASSYQNPYEPQKTTTINEQSNFTWNANVMANFLLSRTLSGQITGDYSAPNVIAQGKQAAQYRIDFGLRKTFLDRTLTLGLTAMDIFNLGREKSTTWGTGFYQTSESFMRRRMLGLTATWNFGNMKPKQSEMKKKQGGNDMMMDGGME